MTHLEAELQQLKEAILDMMELAKSQMIKSKEAWLNMDVELAEEIIHNEKRMNAMELSIDRDCENIFALFNPVATDLRFVISMLKINSDLERIGDYADGIADYIVDYRKPIKPELMEKTNLNAMFDMAISMTGTIIEAFKNEDPKLARKVFIMDSELNQINMEASKIISEFVKKEPGLIRPALFLFSTIRKLERVGDHVKNVAEDIIFYLEAVVLKHRKKKS